MGIMYEAVALSKGPHAAAGVVAEYYSSIIRGTRRPLFPFCPIQFGRDLSSRTFNRTA